MVNAIDFFFLGVTLLCSIYSVHLDSDRVVKIILLLV